MADNKVLDSTGLAHLVSKIKNAVKVSETKKVIGENTSITVAGGTLTGATPASWSASVSEDGVLSFSFTANDVGSVSAVTASLGNDDVVTAITDIGG